MAEFTAKDVQALRQATGAGMMDAKKALTENDGDFEAAAQWLREKGLAKVGQARRPREQPGLGVASSSTATSAPSSSSSARPTSRPSPTTSSSLVQDLADVVAAKGVDAVGELRRRARRPQDLQEGEHRARHGRPLRGRRRQHPRLLPAPPGRPRRQRRARRARGRHPGAGPRHRRAHRLRQAAVPHPRRGRRRGRREGAPGAARHHQGRGQARAGVAQDRRGPPQRLVQGAGAARAGLRPRRQEVHPAAARRSGAKLVRFAQVYIGA